MNQRDITLSTDSSPCCAARFAYIIHRDAYKCARCGAEYPRVYSADGMHAGFIAKNAYSIAEDAFRTCLSCGSKTQPCCGHRYVNGRLWH